MEASPGGRTRRDAREKNTENFQFKSPIVLIVSARDFSLSFKLISFTSLTAARQRCEHLHSGLKPSTGCKQSRLKFKFYAHMLHKTISIQLLMKFGAVCVVQLTFLIAFTLSFYIFESKCVLEENCNEIVRGFIEISSLPFCVVVDIAQSRKATLAQFSPLFPHEKDENTH